MEFWERVVSPANRQALRMVLLLLGLVALTILLIPALFAWPRTDEANYLVQARWIAEGLLPYRDFYDFITPAGQMLMGLVFWLLGFSIPGIRLLVLLGWIAEWVMLWRMGKAFLPKPWLTLFLAFIILTDLRYLVTQHHFWSGLLAVSATYNLFRYLETTQSRYLLISGLAAGLTPWVTQSAGALLLLGLGVFSMLEAKSVRDWLARWGRYWVLPVFGVSLLWIGWLMSQGLLSAFWQDTFHWLLQGNYTRTTQLGYFVTLGEELHQTLLPLMHPLPWVYHLMFSLRIPIGAHLLLLAGLPVLGLLGGAWLLRQPARDPKLLLLWLAGLAMVVSTFSYSTSMHLTSNGGLALLLGWVLVGWLAQHHHALQSRLKKGLWVLLGLILAGMIEGAILQLSAGLWLPVLPGTGTPLLWTESPARADAVLKITGLMERAQQKQERVFILHQSPDLYLTAPARNATRYTLILPVYTPDPQVAEIMADLKRHRPLFIVDDRSLLTLGQDPRFSRYTPEQMRMPLIQEFLATHYQPIAVLDRYVVYRRKPE